MRLLLTLLMFLVTAVAQAQVVQVQQRSCCLLGQCKIYTGSGVVINRTTLQNGDYEYEVLTVAHLTRLQWNQRFNPNSNYGLSVITPFGNIPARIKKYDGPGFLMLLSIIDSTRSADIPAMRIANTIPSPGEPVEIHGFSHKTNGQYGVRSLMMRSVGPKTFTVTSPFEQGESGGPVCNRNGEIIGLCEGYNLVTKIGDGPSVIAIRRFIGLPPPVAIGYSRPQQGTADAGQLPVQPRVPVYSPPQEMRVRDPIADAPPFERKPIYNPGPVVPPPPAEPIDTKPVDTKPAVPVPEQRTKPDPIKVEDSPSIPRIPQATPKEPTQLARDQQQGGSAGTAANDPVSAQSTIKRQAITAAKFGLDLWSVLAGVGLVAGTGGVGAVALWGWRGFKAARALKQMRQGWGGPLMSPPSPVSQQVRDFVNQQPLVYRPPVAPVVAPQKNTLDDTMPRSKWNGTIPKHDITFVEIPSDFRKASVDFALGELARTNREAAERCKSLINQHLSATGHARPDELHL